MTAAAHLIALLPIVGLSACASSGTPLIFGSTTTFGMTVNATPDTQGFDFTLGYKDKNLAIVPVAIKSEGNVEEIDAWSRKCGNNHDALSVFGQFTSKGDWTLSGTGGADAAGTAPKAQPGRVKLDRFFATGLAATHLAEGYRKGMENKPPTDEQLCGKGVVAASTKKAQPGGGDGGESKRPAEQIATGKPQIRRLVYGQSNTVGIGISIQTSMSEQGPNFTFGYSGRDIAFIPTMDWNADGSSARLASRDETGPDGQPAKSRNDSNEVDAYSVLGQFSASSQTQSIDYGLSRFFSTGLAARNLANGFEALIEEQLKADKAASKTAGDKKQGD